MKKKALLITLKEILIFIGLGIGMILAIIGMCCMGYYVPLWVIELFNINVSNSYELIEVYGITWIVIFFIIFCIEAVYKLYRSNLEELEHCALSEEIKTIDNRQSKENTR